MTLEVQMEYTDLEDLATAFRDGAAGITEVLDIIKQVKATVGSGALLGSAGTRLIDIMDGKLIGKLKSGEEKFTAVAKEIESAISNMQQTDEAISHMF